MEAVGTLEWNRFVGLLLSRGVRVVEDPMTGNAMVLVPVAYVTRECINDNPDGAASGVVASINDYLG